MAALRIARSMFLRMAEQARAAAPVEACWLLAGRSGQVSSCHTMTNSDNSPDHFSMKPEEQFAVARKIREAGEELLAIAHSHPASPARPSEEDIGLAYTPDVVYVILSLVAPEQPVLKGFIIDDGKVTETPVLVDAAARPRLLVLPESVRRDVVAYRSHVEAFLRGDTSAVAFRAYRVPMGIYEQRSSGRYMVRVRIAAGIASSDHLRAIAGLARQFGDGTLHVTTRQDIQIHDVALEDTADVLEGLLEAGLSSRGGGGNTVRNISASPSSVCRDEVFDVGPYAVALAEYMLQHKGSFNLPRKYKIAFSGCDDDCGQASVADLGFFAQLREGRRGFRVFAGGGLGREPRPGFLLEEHVEPHEVFSIAEAVRRLFDRHGDRANKHQARLRFVVAKVGEHEFRRLYREERLLIEREGLPGEIPETGFEASSAEVWAAGGNGPDGRVSEEGPFERIRLGLALGDISSEALTEVADLAEAHASGVVLTTQLQDLVLPCVPRTRLAATLNALRTLGLGPLARRGPKIVACTGAATCKLGLCLSRNLATAIAERLADRGLRLDDAAPTIRISGCPNSCGGHQIAAVGLEGGARRVNGRLMPVYSVFVDGRLSGGGATLAERIATVPAKRVPELLAACVQHGRVDSDRLREAAATYEALPAEVPEDYFLDYGASEPFSLAGRGPGECGAGVLDVIRVDLQEAREALKAAPPERGAGLYRAILSAARSLLVVFGIEAKKEREIFMAFQRHLVAAGWISPSANELLDAAIDWRLGDRASLEEFTADIAALVTRVEALFLSLDGELKFRAAPVSKTLGEEEWPEEVCSVDLSGVACPMNFVKAKVALERVPVGGVLEVVLDDGEPIRNVPASFSEQGHEVLGVSTAVGSSGGVQHRLRVRRTK